VTDLDRLATLRDIATSLGVPLGTAKGWRYRYPDFPPAKVDAGRTKLYDAAEVREWHRHHDPAPPGRRREAPR
jgi:hypothetical protein